MTADGHAGGRAPGRAEALAARLRHALGLDQPITPFKLIRDGLVVLGILAAITYWWYLTSGGGLPVDVHAYWAADPNNLYVHGPGPADDAYLYAPSFEFVAGWWRGIPFEAYAAIWRAVLLVILVYLAGPFTLFAMLTVPVASEINAANIQIPLALAVVVGFRWPAAWAFILLTKISPGVGLLWFVIRREWRALAIAIGVTVAIAAVSFVLMPRAWIEYLTLLTSHPAPAVAPYYLPLWTRLPFAIAFVVFGALTDRRWAVVVGATIALPVYWITSSAMFVGVLPYVRQALGRLVTRFTSRRAAATGDPSMTLDSGR
jgi:hypothetical protein